MAHASAPPVPLQVLHHADLIAMMLFAWRGVGHWLQTVEKSIPDCKLLGRKYGKSGN